MKEMYEQMYGFAGLFPLFRIRSLQIRKWKLPYDPSETLNLLFTPHF